MIAFPYSQEIGKHPVAVAGLEHHRRPVRVVSPIRAKRHEVLNAGENRSGSPYAAIPITLYSSQAARIPRKSVTMP